MYLVVCVGDMYVCVCVLKIIKVVLELFAPFPMRTFFNLERRLSRKLVGLLF